MKTKERFQINIVVDKEEYNAIQLLRDKYAINISACFKILLKQYLGQLEKSNIKLEAKR
jgi:hypothetical protein